jgi:putative phosphoribosyl transferase
MASVSFEDRTDAGARLGELLEAREITADLVLAIPRGGLPVGRAVADALLAPLDVIVARKIGAPENPELAIGSVGSDGSIWRNEDLIARLDVSENYIEETATHEERAAREKRSRYRGPRDALDLTDKTTLLIDDGIATGATAIACVRQARIAGAGRVIVAVPVAPPAVVSDLYEVADDVIALETPANFGAVGRFYRSFEQVSDDEAMTYLDG